jgi:hypothetical protein
VTHGGGTVRAASGARPIDAARLWWGGLATAVVAALIGLVGVLIVRTVFSVALYAPSEDGVLGDTSTVQLCLGAAAAALVATGLAHLLLLGTPRPLSYLGWIIGLATAAAVVWPFAADGFSAVTVAQALIHLVIGIAIGSLVTGAAASASRSPRH